MDKKIISIILSLLIVISCFTLVINKSHKDQNSNKIKKKVSKYDNEIPDLNEFLKSYEDSNISLDSVIESSNEYNIKLNVNCSKEEFDNVIANMKKYTIEDFDFIVNNDIIIGTVSITYRNS